MGVLGAALAVSLAALPPFVSASGRAVLMEVFAGICHQLPARSPHWQGIQLAVCDRCIGIYLGVFLGTLAFPLFVSWSKALRKYTGPVLLAAGLPAAVDWGADIAGFWLNTPLSRFFTGALFGLAAGLMLARALASMKGGRG